MHSYLVYQTLIIIFNVVCFLHHAACKARLALVVAAFLMHCTTLHPVAQSTQRLKTTMGAAKLGHVPSCLDPFVFHNYVLV